MRSSDNDIEERLRRFMKGDEIDKAMDQVKTAQEQKALLNVYDAKSQIGIDRMMLQALMKGTYLFQDVFGRNCTHVFLGPIWDIISVLSMPAQIHFLFCFDI